ISNSCVVAAAIRQVFFTKNPVTPGTTEFNSLVAANILCNLPANLPSGVVAAAAVLADSTTSAWDNIQSVGSGIPKDDVVQIVFGTSPVSGPARNPAQVGDFTNSNTFLEALGTNRYWTGIHQDFFTAWTQDNFRNNCINWSNSSASNLGFISGGGIKSSFWSQGFLKARSYCNEAKYLLCIQVNPK
ncbi:MAG: hypothetical protein WCK42_04165, partial [Myxococcaceae bacterium]